MAILLRFIKFILVVIAASLFLIFANGCIGTVEKKEFYGSFHTNDSGESHGGFEWGGGYTASMAVRGSRGDLTLSFSMGLGDYLTRHQFSFSDFVLFEGRMSFKIEGKPALLILVENDKIWHGEYDSYFIGNKSTNESEQIGALPMSPSLD